MGYGVFVALLFLDSETHGRSACQDAVRISPTGFVASWELPPAVLQDPRGQKGGGTIVSEQRSSLRFLRAKCFLPTRGVAFSGEGDGGRCWCFGACLGGLNVN